MSDRIRWGILGPGTIARAFADSVARSKTGKLAAIAARDPAKPGLVESFPGARILEGYDALLADAEIDAIYIATPHPGHAEWAIKAAESGKHILCEKPLGVDAPEVMAMIAAARKAGVLLAEAFMYRFHPQTERLYEMLRNGVIGEIRLIKASFGFAMPKFDPKHRIYANDLAGGGILDIGCYPVSMARLIAGAAQGKPFLDPVKVTGSAHLGQTKVDEWAAAVLEFPDGIVAEVSGSVSLALDNVVRVFGTKGWLEVASPWFCSGRQGGTSTITINRSEGAPETVTIDEPAWLYTFEVDAVGRAIAAGKTEVDPPGPSWADSLGNMKALDAWRKAVGLEYDLEKPERRRGTLSGRPIKVGQSLIRKVGLPGLEKPSSVVGLGCVGLETVNHMNVMLDAFYERGGNFLDTAYHYFMGATDKRLGHWLDSRGVREEMIVLGKGAHSPTCYPDVIPKQLSLSLDFLKTGYLDIYLMHRDNPDIPVGEFVDVIDAEVRAGRVRVYGFSNWTRERFDAATAYAEKNGKALPGALSNNFSLAEMVNPVWPGVMAASDDAWKAWLRKRQIPLLAWSSQARGFFTDRAGPDKRDNPELVNSWYSDKNFGRRERAIELARRLGKNPIHVALAYCLFQDFPVLPIIGPLRLDELADSLEALDIQLTKEDVAWLES